MGIYDVALLRTLFPINFTDKVVDPACLNLVDENKKYDGLDLIISGWGTILFIF